MKSSIKRSLISTIAILALTFSIAGVIPVSAAGKGNGSLLAKWLNPDGTLNLSSGYSGVLNIANYSVGIDPVRGPIFRPLMSGGSWNALGTTPLNFQVYAIAISGTDVYVGGGFTDAGGDVNADNIAKWDGSNWSALGTTPLNGYVDALAVSGSDVYVGGIFTNAGGDANADYIAKWNGSAWSALGTIPMAGVNDYVAAIAVSGSDVYAGGYFLDAGGDANADRIAKWNGSAWSALGTTPLNDDVTAIAISGTDVYVGGYFADAGGNANADAIAKWNGSAWSALGGIPLNGYVFAITISGTDVYVGGDFTDAGGDATADRIAKWNGSAWSSLGGTPLNNFVYAITISGANVYIGGNFTNVNGNANADYIAKWDGSAWSALGTTPLTDIARSIAISGTNVYTGGYFLDAGGDVNADYIALFADCSAAITVTSTADSGAGTLRQAIADTCSGGTITFAAGLSGQTIFLDSTLALPKDVTIDGSALTSKITISGDTNNDNTTTANVRVLYVNSGVTAILNSLIISEGDAGGGDGGGIFNNGGTLTINNSTISDNSTSGYGGGISNTNPASTLIITNSMLSGNTATTGGGAIHSGGPVTLTNSTLSGNTSGSIGGAIYQVSGTTTIMTSILSGNTASASGGGIYGNGGNLTVTDSTLSSNNANLGSGGGIYNFGSTLNVTGSTFDQNGSSGSGGGIYNYPGNILNVTNSTFSANGALYGGAIINYGTFMIKNSTLSGNTATVQGGGIYNDSAPLNYANTIIANSPSGGDCVNLNSIVTNTNNLTGDGSCSPLLSGDPNLGLLANNGGSTQTFALLTGSNAIDAGDNMICAASPVNNLDQRGVTRPAGPQCDIGAYEVPALATATATATATSTRTKTAVALTNTRTATVTSALTVTSTSTPTVTITKTSSPTKTATATRTATVTVTPTAAPITVTFESVAAQDGMVLESSETSSVGGTLNDTSVALTLGDHATKKQYRSIVSFITRTLPDTATIVKVTLVLPKESNGVNGDPLIPFNGFMWDIKTGFFGTLNTLEITDFEAAASNTYGPELPALISGAYSINMTPGKNFINKLTTNGGVTQIRLRLKLDDNNDAIADYLRLFSSDDATPANHPQLVISYYP